MVALAAVLLLLNETMPPLLLTMAALPAVLLSLNWVSAPLFVVMVALAAVLLLLNETMPPLLLTMAALPAVLLSLDWVSAPLFVVMVALAAVLLLLNETTPPLLLMMARFPAELALLKFRLSLLIKLGANAELLTMPVPLTLKVIPVPLVMKLKAGAAVVNWIALIEASLGIVTDVGAALSLNVAVLSGTAGVELQLVPSVHSLPGPLHVPSTACAGYGARDASAARETPASSAGHVRRADGADGGVGSGPRMAPPHWGELRAMSPLPKSVIDAYANDVLPRIDGDGAAAAGHVAGEAVEVGVEVLSLRCPGTPNDEFDAESQGPTKVVCAIRPQRRSRRARDEAADRRAGGHIRHDGIEGISDSQARGAKPIAPHFATRDAGQRGDAPPDAGPGEIGFHAPDERPIGLQIVAQCAAD